jgi:hypothetical protein
VHRVSVLSLLLVWITKEALKETWQEYCLLHDCYILNAESRNAFDAMTYTFLSLYYEQRIFFTPFKVMAQSQLVTKGAWHVISGHRLEAIVGEAS